MTGRAGVVIVFAKAPRPGQVKTRMAPPLTNEQAAELYAHLLDDVLELTVHAARSTGLEPVLAVHPPEACDELERRAPAGYRVVPQRGDDLAARMSAAVEDVVAAGAQRILLRGSDSPVLSEATLSAALSALESVDLVFCPDFDGGYSLVGLCGATPGLFAHPMSTASVLTDTLANATKLGLSYHVLAPSFDLDTIEDLKWLARARRQNSTGTCVKTLDFIDREDLWRHLK